MKNDKLCKTDVVNRASLQPLAGTETLEQVAARAAVCVVGVGATGIRLLHVFRAHEAKEGETFLFAGATAAGVSSDPDAREFGGAALVVMLANTNDAGVLRDMEAMGRRAWSAGALVFAVLAQPATSGAMARNAASAMAGYVDGVIFVPATPHASLLRHVLDAYVAVCTQGDVSHPWRAPIGTDFLDLSASFTGTGQASVGVGQAKGAARSDRASRAVEQAIASIGTAQLAAAAGVLILLIGGRSLRLHEIADTTYAVHAVTARGAAQVLAVQNDERLGDALRVTVIAAGPSA
ncbi:MULTISPECIES: FtsZ/tubulin family protein [Ralstonia]|jgi:cell division protein FtsZ|uniref:Cell division protein FtsZ n=2 Tax=Ralstonia pickettii TaxID=329 RepID=A0ABN9I1D2_RALPI|nr:MULTISPECIES: hypothetical protein [Ralstonia]MBA4200556.1 hypothetical protein [Ralstonia sp.]MBA4230392.1 hypothetical protein [Ralstonia sp.]MBA4236998.1 hypothetical protein [Ralstonia sp.]MBA4279493.1 hypothetical protein [Ralstonia sp.]MBA4402276.1 hypothetical protein [Ralstonia sp.]